MKTVLVAVAMVIAQGSFAFDWSGCKEQTKKFNCSGNDEAIWACLQAHDSELGSCDETHGKYEATRKPASGAKH